jgi:cephalosporin hydroxylase
VNRIVEDYLRWYHDSNIWKDTKWRGVRTLKLPSDLWNYQEIIHERRIQHVIETGTRHGGSALFFADILGDRGRVVTIDIDGRSNQVGIDPRIDFLIGDSGDPDTVQNALVRLHRIYSPLFLILDSDHRCEHVLRELRAWVPKLHPGDYLVVEDTIVNGNPVRPDFGPGPMEAIDIFLEEQPSALIRDFARAGKFGATFARAGHFIKA